MGYGRSRRGVAGNVVLGTLAVLGSLASAIAVGCALNPQPEPPVAAGSGATAGNGGTSGTGATGTGGAGGLGGSGGIAGGGGVSSGGTGGSTAGTGGNADSDAGVSDGGPLVPPDFSDCATAPPSTCSPSATCQALGDCGAPTSFLDTNGCLRKPCTADSECASGERCLPTSLVGGCEPSALESCAPDANGQCMCSVTSDCTSRAQCVAEMLAPRDLDCAVTGLTCEELIVQTTLVMEQLHTNLAPELLDALDACRRALLEARRGGCR